MTKYTIEIKSKKELKRAYHSDYFNHQEWNTIFNTIIEKHNNTRSKENRKFLKGLINKISYRSLLDLSEKNKISKQIYSK